MAGFDALHWRRRSRWVSRVKIALLGPRYEGFNAAFSTVHRREIKMSKVGFKRTTEREVRCASPL
jgi:hypothetical protein